MLKAANSLETMERLARLGSDALTVRPERCVCVRNRHSSCTRCSDACTSGAIAIVDGTLVISQEKCVGCGTCATVCPTCALEVSHPNDATLLGGAKRCAAAHDGCAVFACHRAIEQAGLQEDALPVDTDAASCVSVVCLSRLEETLLTTLFARGITRVVGVHADCQNCPRHDGQKSIQIVRQTMDELARVWKLPGTYIVQDYFPEGFTGQYALSLEQAQEQSVGHVTASDQAQEQSEGRAAASDQAREHAAASDAFSHPDEDQGSQARHMLAHVTHDGTLPHFVPLRRGRLLDALASFGEPVADTLKTRLWGHVEINRSLCTSCRMCAVFCPTGALCKFDNDDGSMGLEHYVAECVHCLLCQDICPNHAIVSRTQVPAYQLAAAEVERYDMDAPEWTSGPDQIVRRMEKKISGNAVTASYSTETGKKE